MGAVVVCAGAGAAAGDVAVAGAGVVGAVEGAVEGAAECVGAAGFAETVFACVLGFGSSAGLGAAGVGACGCGSAAGCGVGCEAGCVTGTGAGGGTHCTVIGIGGVGSGACVCSVVSQYASAACKPSATMIASALCGHARGCAGFCCATSSEDGATEQPPFGCSGQWSN
uniref:hypothetical protein n=1 Tax=Pseudomonas syringae group genomosp. 3 TaxID=251701 RepID=UPI001604E1D7|nr:hypothetical protein [Pseudomonas syringae group genomosp. 3]